MSRALDHAPSAAGRPPRWIAAARGRAGWPPRALGAALGTGLVFALLLAALAWAAFAPIRLASRDEEFAIPHGTYARRMSGDRVEILPDRIALSLGLNDTLLLRNLDDVPQQFGPVVIMPGQSFRLPFEVASTYSFACTAHASGQMSIVVSPRPDGPVQRLRWRWEHRGRLLDTPSSAITPSPTT